MPKTKPFSRGIDSFQIVHANGRFWIASLLFDHEQQGLTLPAKYLTNGGLWVHDDGLDQAWPK
jgi:hypothetical protein